MADNTIILSEAQAKQLRIQKIIALQSKQALLKQYQQNLTITIQEIKAGHMSPENANCTPATHAPPEYDAYGIASKGFVVLSIGSGFIGPIFKIGNDIRTYSSGQTPIPKLEFAWSALSMGGSLFFLAQIGFDEEDHGPEMGWDLAPSSFNAFIQIIVITSLSILVCRWQGNSNT